MRLGDVVSAAWPVVHSHFGEVGMMSDIWQIKQACRRRTSVSTLFAVAATGQVSHMPILADKYCTDHRTAPARCCSRTASCKVNYLAHLLHASDATWRIASRRILSHTPNAQQVRLFHSPLSRMHPTHDVRCDVVFAEQESVERPLNKLRYSTSIAVPRERMKLSACHRDLREGMTVTSGNVTLTKDGSNLIGISIGGGAPLCPCLYIVQIFDNTPAAKDGTLQCGDELIGVNGTSVKGKTKVEVAKMIQSCKEEVTVNYNKLHADPQQGKSLDIVLKKVKHRLVENMSTTTADALGLSRAILCNDTLVKKLEQLEQTEGMYRGLVEHAKTVLKAFYELLQVYKAFGDTFAGIGVREPQPRASEAFRQFGDYHRQMEKHGIKMLKSVKPVSACQVLVGFLRLLCVRCGSCGEEFPLTWKQRGMAELSTSNIWVLLQGEGVITDGSWGHDRMPLGGVGEWSCDVHITEGSLREKERGVMDSAMMYVECVVDNGKGGAKGAWAPPMELDFTMDKMSLFLKKILSDLGTYLYKAIPDTKLTIRKYADTKFEYLSYCLKVKEMDDEEYSWGREKVMGSCVCARLILRCRQDARSRFAQLRSDVLVKMELLDNKHVQDVVWQLQRLVTGLARFHADTHTALHASATLFPVEVDLSSSAFLYQPSTCVSLPYIHSLSCVLQDGVDDDDKDDELLQADEAKEEEEEETLISGLND
ncbi:hypothetical protein PR048_000085 [Dryococelus australis]|uniref:PRKCA-binding protein n=1 Tax=Dryococelus australis TaxID=614101 RepID=A0ABQ9IDN0_9NEOP|nr:hypothetical protein PR048_000085 [Dryococelus australis]